jgi:hypothetical protein
MDRYRTTSAASVISCMARRADMASSTRSASAATSSANWTTASGVSVSQESEGSTRRIAVGSGTGVGAAESPRRAATAVTAGETVAGVG